MRVKEVFASLRQHIQIPRLPIALRAHESSVTYELR